MRECLTPSQPMHDAPVCPECEGPCLQPAVYADGCRTPNDARARGILGWQILRCAACGYEDSFCWGAVLQAWYSAGAYEQRRHEERTEGRPDALCAGAGACHGCQSWCDVCGDVRALCDQPDMCDRHRSHEEMTGEGR